MGRRLCFSRLRRKSSSPNSAGRHCLKHSRGQVSMNQTNPLTLLPLAFATCISFAAEKAVSNGEYEIKFPESWSVSETKVFNGTSARSQLADTTHPKSKVEMQAYGGPEQKEFTLQEFVKFHQHADRSGTKTVEKSEVKVSDVDAIKLVQIHTGFRENVAYRSEHYYLVSGKRHFVIEFFMRNEDHDAFAKEIDAIVKSFKLQKKP